MLRAIVRAAAAVLLIAGVVSGTATAQDAEPLPFYMPLPEGWRAETIPFPLDFAPELTYQGLEELRFAPGMFDAGQQDFWSYAFVWWFNEPTTALSADRLANDLTGYFEGLTRAVAKSREFDPGTPEFQVRIEEISSDHPARRAMRGHAMTFDAFTTREPLNLHLRVRIWQCQDQGHTVAHFELSPQPYEHPIWEDLAAIREGFRCQVE